MRFADRSEAGRRLAERLAHLRGSPTVVLALPRGGVPVGYEVARALAAPLDVIGVRKLGAPGQPELGIGAIAEGDVRVLDESLCRAFDVDDQWLEALEQRERAELERRVRRYRGQRGLPALEGRTVVVTDDGLATGVTAAAALEAVRRQRPERLVLAVPTCAARTVTRLADRADAVVCVITPEPFLAVGVWYERFDQTSDEEVVELLRRARDQLSGVSGQ
jgi:putative phosphoribosyl transferase